MSHPLDGVNPFSRDAYGSLLEDMLRTDRALVRTPFPSLNRCFYGPGRNEGIPAPGLVFVGGASTSGKTLTALNLIEESIRDGWKVGMVSQEMGVHQLQRRLIPNALNIKVGDFDYRNTDVAKSTIRRVLDRSAEHVTDLENAMRVNPKRLRHASEMSAQLNHWREHFGCRVFVVDYLQLIRTDHSEEQIRAKTVELSGLLWDFAQDSESVVIALSQLKRTASENKTKSPVKEDMLGGGSLEADAEAVLLMDHSRYGRDPKNGMRARTVLLVEKVRDGVAGFAIPIEIDYQHMRMREPSIVPNQLKRWIQFK